MTSTGRRGHVSVSRHWLANPDLSDTDLRLMLWLDSHTDTYLGRLNASRTAEQLGWSRDRVKRSLDSLAGLGLLSTEQIKIPGSGSRTWTKITLHQSAWTEDPVPYDEARTVPHDEAHPVPYGKAHTNSTLQDEESKKRNGSDDPWERAFSEWWETYPRHVARPRAFKAYKAKLKSMSTVQMLMLAEGTTRWARYWQESQTEEQFIPHPASFLNAEQYNDPSPTRPSSKTKESAMDIINRIAERDS